MNDTPQQPPSSPDPQPENSNQTPNPYSQQPHYGQQSAPSPYSQQGQNPGEQQAQNPYGQQSVPSPYAQQQTPNPYAQQNPGQPNPAQQNPGQPNPGQHGAGGQQWAGAASAPYGAPQQGSAPHQGSAPYGSAPYAGQGGQPPKKNNKKLLVGLGIGGGGLLLVVAAILVIVLVIVPSFGSSASGTSASVADIESQPDTTWFIEHADAEDRDVSYVSIGNDRALVVDNALPQIDHDSVGWYEGYDEHYDIGWEYGSEYAEAYEEWLDDFSLDIPVYSDFYPTELGDDYWDVYSEYLGFANGFDDAEFGREYGERRIPAPASTDVEHHLTLIDLSDGSEVWTFEAMETLPDIDPDWTVMATSAGGDAIALLAQGGSSSWMYDDEDDSGAMLYSIDIGSGEVRGSTSVESTYSPTARDGIVMIVGDRVSAYDIANLDDGSIWSEPASDAGYGYFMLDYFVTTADVFSVSDGSRPGWASAGESTGYYALGERMLRWDWSGGGNNFDVLDDSGEVIWSDRGVTPLIAGETMFVATDRGESDYDSLMRVDPRNGEEVWDAAVSVRFSHIIAVTDSVVILWDTDGNLEYLQLSNGERVTTQRLNSGITDYWVGESNIYLADTSSGGDELIALDVETGEQVWSYPLRGSSVRVLGDRMMVVDGNRMYALED